MAARKNYNPKSRNNLKQYQPHTSNLKKREEKIAKDIKAVVGADLDLDELLNVIVSAKDVCKGQKEQERFISIVRAYLQDYARKGIELSINDLEDLATLAINQIMITRLYQEAKGSSVADVMAAVEKLKKDNSKLKDQLGSSRRDRVDTKAGQTITVSDIIGEYEKERAVRRSKIVEYEEEETEVKELCRTSVDEMIT